MDCIQIGHYQWCNNYLLSNIFNLLKNGKNAIKYYVRKKNSLCSQKKFYRKKIIEQCDLVLPGGTILLLLGCWL